MFSLTYLSRAVTPLDEGQLLDLLEVSRARNADHAVTGMLLHAEGTFIQTLEGARHDVETIMSSIENDVRHHGVDVTLVEEISERRFPDWTMGFEVLDRSTMDGLRGLNDFLDPEGVLDERLAHLGRAGLFHRAFRDLHPRA